MTEAIEAFHDGVFRAKPVLIWADGDGLIVKEVNSERILFVIPLAEAVIVPYGGMGNVAIEGQGHQFRVAKGFEDQAQQMFDTRVYVQPMINHEAALLEPMPGAARWQYAVMNVGAFNSAERMQQMLAKAGAAGWELAATMDKSSNWWPGMEKGFLLLKRQVPDGVLPSAWCVNLTAVGAW